MNQTLQISISKGKARLWPDGLRCAALRPSDPSRRCNKKIARVAENGQLAGNFQCERCKQQIEVILVAADPAARNNAAVR